MLPAESWWPWDCLQRLADACSGAGRRLTAINGQEPIDSQQIILVEQEDVC
jgi:hypothetical protein